MIGWKRLVRKQFSCIVVLALYYIECFHFREKHSESETCTTKSPKVNEQTEAASEEECSEENEITSADRVSTAKGFLHRLYDGRHGDNSRRFCSKWTVVVYLVCNVMYKHSIFFTWYPA